MPEHGESDMGLFALTREAFEQDLRAYAREVPPGSTTGERNFVPFVPWLAQRKAVDVDDVISATGFVAPLVDLPELGVQTVGQSRLPVQTPFWRRWIPESYPAMVPSRGAARPPSSESPGRAAFC